MCIRDSDYLYSFYLTPVAAKSFFEGASIGFEQKISSFTDVIFSQYNHYFYVNGRTIPHILEQSFAGLWGENCFNLINVFAFLLLNMLVIWISGKRNLTKFGYWVVAVFFIWFLLPCPVDLFLLMSGALNYTWSAVLCLAFLLVYTKVRQMERVNWGDVYKRQAMEHKQLCSLETLSSLILTLKVQLYNPNAIRSYRILLINY